MVHWSAARNEERSWSRGSTTRCGFPSVYIGFLLFMLPGISLGQLPSNPWGATGAVVSWANRPVGVQSWSSPPHPAAPPSAALPRPAHGMSGFWTGQVGSAMPSDASARSGRKWNLREEMRPGPWLKWVQWHPWRPVWPCPRPCLCPLHGKMPWGDDFYVSEATKRGHSERGVGIKYEYQLLFSGMLVGGLGLNF